MGLFRRIFGFSGTPPAERRTKAFDLSSSAEYPTPIHPQKRSGFSATDRYFELSNVIASSKATGDFTSAVRAAKESYPLFPAFVEEMKAKYGNFDISTSHAVHTAGALMAAIGDRDGISALRAALEGTAELHMWLPLADEAASDADLVEKIINMVSMEPGIKQKDLKSTIKGDGRRIGILASLLERGGRIRRVSQGATCLLFPQGFDVPGAAPQSTGKKPEIAVALAPLTSQTSRRRPEKARQVDFRGLQYVPLPKAPVAWEARPARNGMMQAVERTDESPSRRSQPRFQVVGAGWRITTEERLSLDDRPHTAYREVFHTAGTTVLIDRAGKRVEYPNSPSVVLTVDDHGHKIAERGLEFDIYRADVNARGSRMLFLSRNGVLHSYNERLEPQFVQKVVDLPECAAQIRRFDIGQDSLKNHVRCIGISADSSRFLITVVDEAWCYDAATFRPVWGVRFPTKDGWTEVASERSLRSAASPEIFAALELMGLSLPVSPQTIARQYKALAMRWHPDRNPGDPSATRKFQDLGAAMELLTGTDLSDLTSSEVRAISYEQILHRSRVSIAKGVDVTITMSLQVCGAFGADWIYAAGFADHDNAAFLGGYSGRIVQLDASGMPTMIYDIGAVPSQVAKTPSHLFILTSTRLYVLQRDELLAFFDVLDQGRLIVGTSGFGLVSSKRFRWFTHSGALIGEVVTKDPIRRVYSSKDGLVIETRLHRASISGAPFWW